MKIQKTMMTFCIMLSVVSAVMAQTSMNDIFDKNVSMTWLGLDFTGAKLLGDREKYGSSSDVKFLIKSWNDLIEKEHDKYNVGAAFHKVKVDSKIDVTRVHNEELDVTEMLSNDPKEDLHLKQEDIASIVTSYDFEGLTGLGLMFNIESFNKFNQKGAIWVTLVDLGTKEIIHTERILGAPGGSGLRNYWARSILEVMEEVKGKQYKIWQKKYAH